MYICKFLIIKIFLIVYPLGAKWAEFKTEVTEMMGEDKVVDCYSGSNHSTRKTEMLSLSSSLPFAISSVSLMKSRERKSTTARKETLQTLRSTSQPFPGQ